MNTAKATAEAESREQVDSCLKAVLDFADYARDTATTGIWGAQ